jgi:tetratricopeptide (TPR) repeat protein
MLPTISPPPVIKPNAPSDPVALQNADRYYWGGLQAEKRKDYVQARYYFERALAEAHKGNGTLSFVSGATYNLGRMVGYTCDFAEAERLLLESLDLEVPLSGPDSVNISKRLFELARLNQAQARFARARRYYEQAIPMAERLGILAKEPLALATVLDDYATVLEETSQPKMTETTRSRAQALRAQHPGQASPIVFVRYDETCAREAKPAKTGPHVPP